MREEGERRLLQHAALPPARAVTRLQKYDFAMDYFCGSNDLASKGKWVTFVEV